MTDDNTIDDNFLNHRELFALEYREGMVFLEVQDWEFVQYRPYSGVGTVGSEESSGFVRLDDGNRDILHIEKGEEKVLHGSVGIYPNNFRQYTRYPEGGPKSGTWPNLQSPSSGNGDDYGYVSGNDSPYSEPTEEGELFIPPGVHLSFDFFNTGVEDRTPKLNLRFREYDVNILDPFENKHQNAIRRIIQPGSPMPIVTVGTMGNRYSYDLQDSWGVQPMSYDQLDNVVNGNGGNF